METYQAVIEIIEDAFRDVPLGKIGVHEAAAIDDYAGDEWRDRERIRDGGRKWIRYSDEELESCPHALSHFDPEGWRHFIPAFMIWSLRHCSVSDLPLVDYVIYTFDPTDSQPDFTEYKLERFELLDYRQRKAVFRFLCFMAVHPRVDSDSALKSLEQYWGRFSETRANSPS